MCVGDNPVIFTSTAPSTGSCGTVTSYQWQQDPGCTGTWSDISGASFITYDAPAGIAQTTCYRRMVIDPACNRTAVSNTTTVTLYPGQQGNPATFPLNTWNGYVYDFAVVGFGGGANTGWTDYKGYYTYAGVSTSDPSFNTSAFYATANLPTSAPGYLGCQLAGTTLNV